MDLRELLIPLLFDPGLLAAVSLLTILTGALVGSLVEYLFPPFWGDTLILMGFLAAGEGTVPLWAAFLTALVGSTAGAWAAYLMGARLGELPWLPDRLSRSDRMERVRAWVQRKGAAALLLNRFLPGIRALFLPLAGALHIPAGRALAAATVGNCLWLSFLASGARAAEGAGSAVTAGGLLLLAWGAMERRRG